MSASTDLGEIVRERLAAKIRDGKAPSKADLAWLEATAERSPASSSVELSRNAKGDMQFTVKSSAIDAYEAERIALDIAGHLRAVFPMQDGTVGSKMDTDKVARKAAAIAHAQGAKA